MKIGFTHQRHPRGYYDRGMVVTASGKAAAFKGEVDVPGVCRVVYTGSGQKNGHWTPEYYDVFLDDTSTFFSWIQDWDSGAYWPQNSWEEGLKWLASKAPSISPEGFAEMIRRDFPKVAEAWDAEKANRDEFGGDIGFTEAEANAATAKIIAAYDEAVEAAKRREAVATEKAHRLRDVAWYLERAERAEKELAELEAKCAGIDEETARAKAEKAEAELSEIRAKADAIEAEARAKAAAEAEKAKIHQIQAGTWGALDALQF